MFSIPRPHGGTTAERNADRTKSVDLALRDMLELYRTQANAVELLRSDLADADGFGREDAVDAPLAEGRRNWIASRLADDILRHERQVHELAIKATALAAGYELTTD